MSYLLINQSRNYVVTTPIFEGPLDLLLHLIERSELDITRLALAQITDQYLEHLKLIENRAPDEVSAFLVVAAKLIQIKSESLLPHPTKVEIEEDTGEKLAQQLRIYKRFKELSNFLLNRENAQLRTYPRSIPVQLTPGKISLIGVNLNELLECAKAVFSNKDIQININRIVSIRSITIKEKIRLIIEYLRCNKRITFSQLIERKPIRLEIVITFLAILELIKQKMIQARQHNLFKEIEIEPDPLGNENLLSDIEVVE